MRLLILFIFTISSLVTVAQKSDELKFIEHLVNQHHYEEVIYLISNNPQTEMIYNSDSVNYFLGWAQYSLKNLEPATESFLKVSSGSPLYYKSHFFGGYNQIHLNNYKQARYILDQLSVKDQPILESLRNFQYAGVSLLEGDYQKSQEFLLITDPQIAALSKPVSELSLINQRLRSHSKKSPLLAGILSAIVPGSGMVYAGKKGQGIAAFIAVTGFGLITWENYRKLGPTNYKTLLFGGIFLANYSSTLYGSVHSVNAFENEYRHETKNQILFQLHLPLRNIFEN